ncbi:MAG: hypothetical protein KDC92_16805 [Bacteroidetes bacterium]|nr:hypothetical protein [Bacteroidota bacterium]MCB0739172.1 hypothetical protein [Bacteroidota bacterium]
MLKHPFKTSLLFGIPMLIMGGILLFINPRAEANLAEGFYTPIIAFEFIQSAVEVRNYFQVEFPNIYRNDMMLGNNLDFLFMFFYSAFLGFTGLGILKETKERALWLPIVLTIVMFFADLFENLTMASIITDHFNGKVIVPSYFGNLKFFTWLKWGSIAAVLLMYSGYFWQRNKWAKIIAVVAAINFAVAIAAFFHRSVLNEIMASMVILLFLMVFIHNVTFKTRMLQSEKL